jgi:hypothetical protein
MFQHLPQQPYAVAQPPSEVRKTGPIKTTLSAVFLSFPLVFLEWSISSFLVGLLVFAFRQTTGGARIILAFIIGLISFALAAVYVFFFAIWNEDGRSPLRKFFDAAKAVLSRNKNEDSEAEADQKSRQGTTDDLREGLEPRRRWNWLFLLRRLAMSRSRSIPYVF